jgi:hypothetical protein
MWTEEHRSCHPEDKGLALAGTSEKMFSNP